MGSRSHRSAVTSAARTTVAILPTQLTESSLLPIRLQVASGQQLGGAGTPCSAAGVEFTRRSAV